MDILYEDNHCIAVVKPAGQAVQDDQSKDLSFLQALKNYLKEENDKPGEAFVGLVHRLDRPVGGVMVFAKTSKGASRLSEQFRSGRARKTYWAIVEGVPEEESGRVIQWLYKDESKNTVISYERDTPNTKKAETDYRVLGMNNGRSLVEVKPLTGRSHQIRLAMKSLGCPIVGDLKYGSKKGLGNFIALWARQLVFAKPVGGEEVTVKADPNWPLFPGAEMLPR